MRQLLIAVDGSYTNKVLLKALPEHTTLIGRIRQDADLHRPLDTKPNTKGRPRKYGLKAPTPKEVLSDDSIPFEEIPCFAVGKIRDFKVKVLQPVFWRKAGHDKPLILVVIKPMGYRLRKGSKLLYREPAFLICTDPNLDLKTLVQAYLYRWEIEVNHHDKKASSELLKRKRATLKLSIANPNSRLLLTASCCSPPSWPTASSVPKTICHCQSGGRHLLAPQRQI